MIRRLIIVVLALSAVFGGIFGWKYYQARRAAARASMPPPPVTVAAARVEVETWHPFLYAAGSLVATRGVFVSNEIDGQVKEINFKSGQRIKQGDLLVQLDDSVDRAELQGLIAGQRLAELQFKRQERLLKERSTSRSAYDEAAATFENATAQVTSQRARIKKKGIRAPFSGVLGIRQIDLGEYLNAGSQIVSLQALTPIYVDYSLPERELAKLSPGQNVVVKIQTYPDRSFEGRITAISARVDPATRNVKIRAAIDNPDELLRPGMFAEVRTILPERQNILTLPQTAITYNPYGDSVFVIGETNGALAVQRRQVETGEVRDGRIEVRKGLKAGERVVRAGQVKLRNGQRVQINNSIKLDQPVRGP